MILHNYFDTCAPSLIASCEYYCFFLECVMINIAITYSFVVSRIDTTKLIDNECHCWNLACSHFFELQKQFKRAVNVRALIYNQFD